MMSSKKRLVICMFALLILATLMPLSAAADQPTLKSYAQEVVDEKVEIYQSSSNGGPWKLDRTYNTYKTLFPPSGYYYVVDHKTFYYGMPYLADGCYEKKKTAVYSYKLAPL